jgi:hypothetical protein
MGHYLTEQALLWAILALGAFAGSAAGVRWGNWALIGILALVWPCLLVADLLNTMRLAPQFLELNSARAVFGHLWPKATISLVVVAVPMLFALRTRLLRRVVGWGVAAATIWAFVLPVPLIYIACFLFGDCL